MLEIFEGRDLVNIFIAYDQFAALRFPDDCAFSKQIWTFYTFLLSNLCKDFCRLSSSLDIITVSSEIADYLYLFFILHPLSALFASLIISPMMTLMNNIGPTVLILAEINLPCEIIPHFYKGTPLYIYLRAYIPF